MNSKFDDAWSGLINNYPDFVTLAAKTASRKDYRKWHDQHRTWSFHTVETPPGWTRIYESKNLDRVNAIKAMNAIAFIVGPFGDMKGAVQCAGQPIV